MSMEKAKIRPSPRQNPLIDFHQIGRYVTSWIAPGMQNFVAIGSGGFCSQYMILPCLWGD